ncbi:MAG: ABC transporter permease subunit [bacterium]|nr:ABC transporter permease subunit [bacterium]
MTDSGIGWEVFEIMGVSLRVSLTATLLATLCSVPAGFLLAVSSFRGKRTVVTVVTTLMALPTVVVGLLVYILLSRSGPLGSLGILYTPAAMIVGQFILALPIITALTYTAVSSVDLRVRKTAESLGASPWQASWMVLKEGRLGIIAAIVAGFGRVIAEVGSAIMVGGNIRGYTRTMTTTITLETAKGNFALGLALGLILLVVALSINALVLSFLGRRS